MPELDFSSDFGKRLEHQLQSEQVVWLTTVSPSGQPQPSPVWFIWRGDQVLVFSEPGGPKVRNIRANARVALAFNTDPHGQHVSILQGKALLRETQMTPADVADFTDYVEKYAGGIKSLNLTPQTMLTQYSQLITIAPTKMRGW